MRFYEINPEVERLATSRFTYLTQCWGKVEVILGDARLSLDLLFVVDLVFSGIIVAGIALSRGGRPGRARAAAARTRTSERRQAGPRRPPRIVHLLPRPIC